jgi:predicted nucleic acid-binding protein
LIPTASSTHLRRPRAAQSLPRRLHAQGEDLCVCDVVVAEIYSGPHAPDRARATEELLLSLGYLRTSPEAATQAGVWRYRYAREGRALATTDCLVAATAHACGATLVTGNRFSHGKAPASRPALTLLTLRSAAAEDATRRKPAVEEASASPAAERPRVAAAGQSNSRSSSIVTPGNASGCTLPPLCSVSMYDPSVERRQAVSVPS